MMASFNTPGTPNIEAFKQAIRVLSHVRADQFNLQDWRTDIGCGHVACIGGHCGQDDWFRDRGFYTVVVDSTSDGKFVYDVIYLHDEKYIHTSWEAMYRFFGTLLDNHGRSLFEPAPGYMHTGDVIERFTQLIDEYERQQVWDGPLHEQ